jgi:ribosomal protein S18 acetylase RimI-like enzyme
MGPAYTVRPARDSDPTVLLELAAGLRRILRARGEQLASGWPEEAVGDLKAGRLDGWLVTGPGEERALAILSAQEHRAFGQLHLETAGDPVPLAAAASEALVGGLPPAVRLLDFGLTGPGPEEEARFAGVWSSRPGRRSVRRFGLLRALPLGSPPEVPALPTGFELVPARAVSVAALAELDLRAFRGGPDEELLPETPDGDRRLLEGIEAGQLGRFLAEASAVLQDPEGRLAGFVLTVEENPDTGLIVDLAVRPDLRGRGLGGILLRRALRALVALGHRQARLWVTEANRPAARLYEAVGFRTDAVAYIYRWSREGAATASPQREA